MQVQIWIVFGCCRDRGASDVALLCQGDLVEEKVGSCVFLGCAVCIHGIHECPGAAAQVELPGATPGLRGARSGCQQVPWVLFTTQQNCRAGLFPFLLQEFPGIPALLCPLLKGNSGKTPVPLPGLALRVQKSLSLPSPGEGVCFHP